MKKFLSIILAIILTTTALILPTSAASNASEVNGIMGDTDNDGVVTAFDARLALRQAAFIARLTEDERARADVDFDGAVQASDARTILRIAARLDSSYCIQNGHDYHIEVIPPTCTTNGYTLYTCGKCGNSKKDFYVPATGHKYGNWQTIENGRVRTCTVCGYKDYETHLALKPVTSKKALEICNICGIPNIDDYREALDSTGTKVLVYFANGNTGFDINGLIYNNKGNPKGKCPYCGKTLGKEKIFINGKTIETGMCDGMCHYFFSSGS